MNASKNELAIKFEKGSDNVFADLGLPDADERLVKAELVFKINQIIKKRKLKQAAAADLLKTDQSKISLLQNGRVASFSIERLVKYLTLLNQDVELVIKRSTSRKKPYQGHGCFRVVYA